MEQHYFSDKIDKSAFRSKMTSLRDGIPEQVRATRSVSACKHIIHWLEENSVASLMSYVAFRSELHTGTLLEWAWQAGVQVIVPKCYPSDRSMTLHRLEGWDGLLSGAYGIMEPDPARCPALPESYTPELIIVPGLAFDKQGGRLGYGGGYYDRFAAHQEQLRRQNSSRMKTTWLGTGYAAQVVEDVPMQSHDQRMDALLTENGIHCCKEI